MISVENKYKLGQQVFYYKDGSIWHCRISEINIAVKSSGNRIKYDIIPYNETLFTKLCNVDESELVSDIQDIINIIPIK